NAYEEKKLYLNLRHQPSVDNPEDNFDFEFLKNDEIPQHDESNYWFKVGNILDMGSVISYVRENNLNDDEAQILEKLKEVFCIQKLISYFEETEKNLDKVLKIFIRVNSGGTQLSYSDLLMSILTANFSSDIRDLMNKLVDTVEDEGFGVMGRDQILKTCLILTESNHIFALKNFSKANIHKIENNWEEITIQIYNALKLLVKAGYRNRLSSAYIITSIAFYLFKYKNVTDEDVEEITNFIRLAQIKSYFTTSLDNKLEIVAKAIRNNGTFKAVNSELANNKLHPLTISVDDIERMIDLQYGSPAILPVLQFLYPNLDYKNSTFHIDHIYPKSRFNSNNSQLAEDYQGKANFLFNLQLLQGDENNSKRAKDPEVWICEEFNDGTKQKDYKKRNYINEDLDLSWENISQLESQRNVALVTELKSKLLNT
ncbi:MAG TPA: DUF1524 domain-containing protein, partial [Candidatus Dojkabacteria bacterium]|nr:DUF1524 domain-containing protein [Candidatus Dojkabacteria bacterium]